MKPHSCAPFNLSLLCENLYDSAFVYIYDSYELAKEIDYMKALGYLKDALNVSKKTNVLDFHTETLELLSKVYAKLEKSFSQWKGNYEQIDDILILGIEV